ncbi:MAG: hypothetical protein ABUT39_19355 [Acidobacteriota bacterium]
MKNRWLLPYLLLVLHALLFGAWIVDDAGISFSYARSLASGYGLVSQPGLPPVEGFSNFLWTVGLAPLFLVRLFHPVYTPKLISLALLAGSFFLLDRSLLALTNSRAVCRVALLLLAVCTPFVAWTVSGLENPLYVLLLSLLLWLIVRERDGGGWPRSYPIAAGAVAAGIAMTRPDGAVFAALYPLLTVALRRSGALGRLLRYGAALALLLGGFLLFRWTWFGQLFPNTYFAKGGPSPEAYVDLLTLQPPMMGKVFDLFESVAGRGNVLLLAGLAAGTAYLIGARRFRWGHLVLLAFACLGAAPYLLLPHDWMPEFRFATPFFPFLYAYGVALAASLGEGLSAERRRLPALAGGLAAVGLSLALFAPRTVLFAAAPTVPFDEVIWKFGLRYNHFADVLGLRQGSILLPDVGGTLWTSRLRVYDLAGLTDPVIARTLDKAPEAFYDYIFEHAKPTFIHTHHYWTLKAGFDYDPRFFRDYVPLFDFVEPAVVQRARGDRLRSGDFVRRDAIAGKDAAVARIRAELVEYYEESRPELERRGSKAMEAME